MGNKRLNGSLWVYAMPIILALMSLGCGLSNVLGGAGSSSNATPTRTPMPTFTITPAEVTFEQASPTPIPPLPTNTPVPTPEVVQSDPAESSPLPTPEPAEEEPANTGPLTITLTQNMNVRGGPGTNYPIIGPGPAGESAKVLGRNGDSSWLQVEYPSNDGTGWVYADLVQINGDPETAEIVQAPPPPVAAAPPPQEKKEDAPPPEPAVKYQFTPTGWHASENAAICHFKGRIRDEGGNLVNGFSVYVTNDAWGTISHPAGASNHYPDKGDGEWDVAGINLGNCPGWWKLMVVRYDCPNFFGGFNAECKDFTILSEKIPVELVYPEEMVINADWVCHWDCNTGLYVDSYKR